MRLSPGSQSSPGRLRVWDLATRLMHWGLAVAVIGALACVQIGGNAMVWHLRFGYCALAFVVARMVWGLIGPRYARFASFAPHPRAAFNYLKSGAKGVFAGHNPAGALSVYAMLFVITAQATTGLFSDDEVMWEGPLTRLVSGEFVSAATSLHHLNGNVVYLLIALHLGAIVFHTWIRRDPLVRPMITGDRPMSEASDALPAKDGLRERVLGIALIALSGTLVWWLVR